jgi:hypothetical protein
MNNCRVVKGVPQMSKMHNDGRILRRTSIQSSHIDAVFFALKCFFVNQKEPLFV